MLVSEVSKLKPLDRFLYWIRERHSIYLKRQAGEPKPWTDDRILQSYYFTNPYRENDKTTVWFRENVRDPLRNHPSVLFATVCFRWFNYIPTGELLLREGLLTEWSEIRAIRNLKGQGKVFTGAFMISSPRGVPKIDGICNRLSTVWHCRKQLTRQATRWRRLRDAHEYLLEFPGLGGFMAYEVVCDWRYTAFLERAADRFIWCNPGPGCIRGLYRLCGKTLDGVKSSSSLKLPTDWLGTMRSLRAVASDQLSDLPRIEMREIEHSLCEWDKYERARLGTGQLKRRYNGHT